MRPPDSKKALTVRPAPSDYEVGYRKPPVQSRFKPGHSGNPRGRPRGSRARQTLPLLNEERLKGIIIEEAYRYIKVNDANRQISIPMAQAIVRSLAVNAAKGNQRAQRLFTELLTSTERDYKRSHDEWLETAIEYKVSWDEELDRRKRLGITDAPDPLPHPDHIIIDMNTGAVRVTGPMTKEQKVRWDRMRERRDENELDIEELQKMLKKKSCQPYRALILDEIQHCNKLRAMFAKYMVD